MAIEFECPVCNATIRVKDEAAGKKGRCPQCKSLLLVPEPDDEPAEPPSSPLPVPPQPVAPPPTAPVSREPLPAVPSAPAAPIALPPAPIASSAHDLGSPFGIVPDTEPILRPPAASRRRAPFPVMKVVSAAAGLLCTAAVLLVGWLLYRSSQPDLMATVTGDRLASAALESASFVVPTGVPQPAVDRVMNRLATDPLSLKSEYVEVTLKEKDGHVEVAVAPGPQAVAIRVPLAKNAAVRSALAKSTKSIQATKRDEIESAATELFTDYAAYLETKKPMTRLPRHRDSVAFNATTDAVGYAVEAVIAEVPFRCVAQDADGHCYFFLPSKTKTFRIRGRELPDGTTPLPVDFEVKVKEVAVETVTVEEVEPSEEPIEGPAEPEPEQTPSDSSAPEPSP